MPKAGSCFFSIGYFLYTRTRIGYFYHKKNIREARDKLGDSGHSELMQFDYNDLSIVPIPMLLDNYAYLVTDTKTTTSVLIDPGHSDAVQKVLKQRKVQPAAILTTHKHWDHSGGNRDLRHHFPGIPVYGGDQDHVPDATHMVRDGDVLTFGNLRFRALFTPGHTVGHLVFLLEGTSGSDQTHLFSGDTLFLGGCGRMFEAPPSVMLTSLDKLMALEDSTLLWPGHEYASDNLEFAHHVDPDNLNVQRKLEWVKSRRGNTFCTCPSTIQEEKEYNPFLRTSQPEILKHVGLISMEEITRPSDEIRARALGELRESKDRFKYTL